MPNEMLQRALAEKGTIYDGDKPFVSLSKPVVFESGSVMETVGTIGQSVCVLRKGRE
jgi:hypothetical protein